MRSEIRIAGAEVVKVIARTVARALAADPELAARIEALLRGLTTDECEQVRSKVQAYPGDLGGDDLVLAVDASINAIRESRARTGVLRPISDFESREVAWLWPGRIPLGMLTLLEGDPKVGKSTLSLDIAARASRGDLMPGASAGIEAAHVILLSAEDPIREVIRPRLEAAGADLDRVHVFGIQDPAEAELQSLTLCSDQVAFLEAKILECGAKLTIVDPLMAYMPDGTDTNSDHSVRRVLRLLSALGERTGCGIVVIRHWRKGETPNALYRGGGSIGFTAAARSILNVGYDPNDSAKRSRVLAHVGSNVTPDAPSLAFRLEVEGNAGVPRIQWQGISPLTASDLTQAQNRNPGRQAEDFLRERVTTAWVPAAPLLDEAEEIGMSEITLRRAAKRLGISQENGTIRKAGDGRSWLWRLPGQDDQGDLSASNGHLRGSGSALDDHLPGKGDAFEGDL